METNITYLLGAGASAQTIPIVNGMADSILDLINDLDHLNTTEARDATVTYNNVNPPLTRKVEAFSPRYNPVSVRLTVLIEELKWLHEQAIMHSSLDTAAKKFYIKGEDDQLKRLKRSMAVYFLTLQNRKGIDKRYDKFWASILKATKHERIVPDNVKILTWNYDHQLIWSFNNFVKSRKHALQACSTPEGLLERKNEGFFIGYLNGVAGAYWLNDKHLFPNKIITTRKKEELFKELNRYYDILDDEGIKFNLRFAWEYLDSDAEENSIEKRYLEKIIEEIKTTNILVVIGYSFPNFNNEVDRMLIDAMNKSKSLRKVYVQVPEEHFDEREFKLKEYFAIKNEFKHKARGGEFRREDFEDPQYVEVEKIIRVSGLYEFFIPPEF